jgi:ABC-2 type transport system permease protein
MSTPATSTRPAAAETYQIDILLTASRPRRRAGALAASAIFGWRAMLKIRHDPKQLVDSAAIPILFTVLFTYLFGGAISGSPGTYLKILLPGTLTMSIAIVTMYGGARLAQDVTTGAFDRFRALSVWRGAFGLSLSCLWAAVALLMRDPAVVISIANVVLMPLSFASNVFVQPQTMPGWLQAFVDVNPLSHLATAARDLMNNTSGAGGPVAWSLIATAAITAVCAPLTLRLYSKQG